MRVSLVNTFDTKGGAAIACSRLLTALYKSGVEAQLLVHEKSGSNTLVKTVSESRLEKKLAFIRFIMERLYFFTKARSKEVLFAFSPANVGIDISKRSEVVEADVIHLHWINFGYLSLNSLKKLVATGKPIVWTLHDMWAFTGGCHYSGSCTHYLDECGNCPFLNHPSSEDLSHRILIQKLQLLNNANISVVACSKWLAGLAKSSKVFRNFNVTAIPNPIDINFYKPLNKEEIRIKLNLPLAKKLILFGAMSTKDKRKGFIYLTEALNHLKLSKQHDQDIELIVFGKAEEEVLKSLPFKVHYLGSINSQEKLVEVYNAADLAVSPSLEDNLPNTIMEALACGTPVVAFDTGGIPEMIDHLENGYLASYKSSKDLAEGLNWVLNQSSSEELSTAARKKVLLTYSEEIVADQYRNLYSRLVKK